VPICVHQDFVAFVDPPVTRPNTYATPTEAMTAAANEVGLTHVFIYEGDYVGATNIDGKEPFVLVGEGAGLVRIESGAADTLKLKNLSGPAEIHDVTITNTASGRALKLEGNFETTVTDVVIGPTGGIALEQKGAGGTLILTRARIVDFEGSGLDVEGVQTWTNVLVTGGRMSNRPAIVVANSVTGTARYLTVTDNLRSDADAAAFGCANGHALTVTGSVIVENSTNSGADTPATCIVQHSVAPFAPSATNPIACTPWFVDAANDDFTLLPGSSCTDTIPAGVPTLVVVKTDLQLAARPAGDANDPGAFESPDVVPYCGNDVLETPEECDLGPDGNNGAPGLCNTDCTIVDCPVDECPVCALGDTCSFDDETCDDETDVCLMVCAPGADCNAIIDGVGLHHHVECHDASCDLSCNSVSADCDMLCTGDAVCNLTCNSVSGSCDFYCDPTATCTRLAPVCNSVSGTCTNREPADWPH